MHVSSAAAPTPAAIRLRQKGRLAALSDARAAAAGQVMTVTAAVEATRKAAESVVLTERGEPQGHLVVNGQLSVADEIEVQCIGKLGA